MRILALIPYVPNPPHGGGEQRLHNVLAALCDAGEVTVVGLARAGDVVEAWPLADRFATPPSIVRRDADGDPDDQTDPLKRLFPPPPSRWPRRARADCHRALWEALGRLDLDRFDVVHVESLGMVPYGVALKAKAPRLRLQLDLDNIDAVYAWGAFRAGRVPWLSRQAYWQFRNVAGLFRFTRRWLGAFDAVWVCSEADRRWALRWTGQGVVHVVPNGMDCAKFAGVVPHADGPRLTMAGTMMEGPNSDGAVWFADRVLPAVRRAVLDAEFWCVGREPCPEVAALAGRCAGVTVTGSVAEVGPYLAGSAVAVAPIRFGTGTRLKILEAMAAGLPVVSTRVGAAGLDFAAGRDLVLADRPAEFAAACVRLLLDGGARAAIGAAGRAAVQKYDWAAIHARIGELTRRCRAGDARDLPAAGDAPWAP